MPKCDATHKIIEVHNWNKIIVSVRSLWSYKMYAYIILVRRFWYMHMFNNPKEWDGDSASFI